MKKYLLVGFLFLFVVELGVSQSFDWVLPSTHGGNFISYVFEQNSQSDMFLRVHFDNSQTDSFDIDPSASQIMIAGAMSAVQKYDKEGLLLWSHIISPDPNGYANIRQIEASNDDGVVVFGEYVGTVDFDFSGQGLVVTSISDTANRRDLFVYKLDSQGSLEWFKEVGNVTTYGELEMCVNPDNGVCFAFYLLDALNVNTSANPVVIQPSNNSRSIAIVSLDPQGNFNWTNKVEVEIGPDYSQQIKVLSMVTDQLGDLYVSLEYNGPLKYVAPDNQVVSNLEKETQYREIGIIKFFPNGFLQDHITYERSLPISLQYGGLQYVNNQIIMNGSFRGTYDFDASLSTFNLTSNDPNKSCHFAVALNTDLSFKNAVGGHSYIYPFQFLANEFGIYYRLRTSDALDLDFGPSSVMTVATSGVDRVYIVKLDSNLNYDQSYSYALDHNKYHTQAWFVNNDQAYYSIGYIQEDYDFDPGLSDEIVNANVDDSISTSVSYLLKLDLNQTPTGVIENSTDKPIQVYPNPSNSGWTIKLEDSFETAEIKLFDISGKQVYSQNFSGNSAIWINPKLSSGLYIGTISTNKGTQVVKLIRE